MLPSKINNIVQKCSVTHLKVAFQPGRWSGREASWVFKIAGEAERADAWWGKCRYRHHDQPCNAS
jgi:hypothetical protein